MSPRDPRVDPQPGDLLCSPGRDDRGKWGLARVKELRKGEVYYALSYRTPGPITDWTGDRLCRAPLEQWVAMCEESRAVVLDPDLTELPEGVLP